MPDQTSPGPPVGEHWPHPDSLARETSFPILPQSSFPCACQWPKRNAHFATKLRATVRCAFLDHCFPVRRPTSSLPCNGPILQKMHNLQTNDQPSMGSV